MSGLNNFSTLNVLFIVCCLYLHETVFKNTINIFKMHNRQRHTEVLTSVLARHCQIRVREGRFFGCPAKVCWVTRGRQPRRRPASLLRPNAGCRLGYGMKIFGVGKTVPRRRVGREMLDSEALTVLRSPLLPPCYGPPGADFVKFVRAVCFVLSGVPHVSCCDTQSIVKLTP